jgi:2-dehydro-3-deoxygluconokinase
VSAPLVVGLGEAMVRLSVPGRGPLAGSTSFEASVGGAELNALTCASALGARARFLTALPDNALAETVRRAAAAYGVEVRGPVEAGGRLGLYLLERGSPPRASRVTYDRAHSAASHLDEDSLDWAASVAGAAAAHLSGITLMLGPGPRRAASAFLAAARAAGATTSLDPNYRSALATREEWTAHVAAALPLVDVLFVSPDDLAALAGGAESEEARAARLRERDGVGTVVVRERASEGLGAVRVSVREAGGEDESARALVVDELGAGDAAAGAYLAARSLGRGDVATRWAARACARALTLPGDLWWGSVADLEADEDAPAVRR